MGRISSNLEDGSAHLQFAYDSYSSKDISALHVKSLVLSELISVSLAVW